MMPGNSTLESASGAQMEEWGEGKSAGAASSLRIEGGKI